MPAPRVPSHLAVMVFSFVVEMSWVPGSPVNDSFHWTFRIAPDHDLFQAPPLTALSVYFCSNLPGTLTRAKWIPHYRYSAGIEMPIGERQVAGINYTYAYFGKGRLDQVALPPLGTGILDGRYTSFGAHFIAMTLKWM